MQPLFRILVMFCGLTFFATTSFATDPCDLFFRSKNEIKAYQHLRAVSRSEWEKSILDRRQKLEKKLGVNLNLTGSGSGAHKRASKLALDRKVRLLEALLAAGSDYHQAALDLVRKSFTVVELGWARIVDAESRIAEARNLIHRERVKVAPNERLVLKFELEILEAQTRIEEQLEQVGKFYVHFKGFYLRLKELSRSTNPEVREGADFILGAAGITSKDLERFRFFLKDRTVPEWIDIESLAQRYPQLEVYILETELWAQRFNTFLAFALDSMVIDSVRTVVDKMPRSEIKWLNLKGALKKFFQIVYDYHGHKIHDPTLAYIFREVESVRLGTVEENGNRPLKSVEEIRLQQYEDFVFYSSQDKGLLYAFARRIDLVEKWDEMKALAQSDPKNTELKSLMVDAERGRQELGYTSPIFDISPVRKIVITSGSLSGVAYYVAQHWQEIRANQHGFVGWTWDQAVSVFSVVFGG